MGITDLLRALKNAIEAALDDMLLDVNPDTGDYEERNQMPMEPEDGYGAEGRPEDDPEYWDGEQKRPEPEPKQRPPDVYLMNMPERADYLSRVPYLLIQFLSSKDKYDKEDRDRQATADIRILIATYNRDGQDGGMQVLEIVERIRIHLLSGMLLDGNYMLTMPFDTEVYPDDTGNYFLGEINMTWSLPNVERAHYYIEDVRRKDD